MRFPSEPPITDDRTMVEEMITAGMTLGEIEEQIDRLPAGDEHKSALWLTAWSRLASLGQWRAAEPGLVRAGSGA